MRRRRSDSIDEPPINLTPLIDVVFVILIGFIIIAPMLDRDQVELATRPSELKSMSECAAVDQPIQLKVLEDDSIWLRGKKIELAQLHEALSLLKQSHPEAEPVVIHDRRATFGTYQEVKNACEKAGFKGLDIILKPV
jgi:biopolymer transport protein ExbD